MKKILAIGSLGLALVLAHGPARAHDEAAYFVLGAIVGSTLTRSSVHYAPVVYSAPVRYVPAYRHVYYPPRQVMVVDHRYYSPAPRHRYRVDARHRHPHGGPPGHRRHYRGR